MTNHYIENHCSDIENKDTFSDMSSYINIWNISDSKSDEEEKLKIDDPEFIHNQYSEILSYLIYNIWVKIKINTNNGYTSTGYMLHVIPHIFEVVFEKPNGNYRNYVNFFYQNCFLIYLIIKQMMLYIVLDEGQ